MTIAIIDDSVPIRLMIIASLETLLNEHDELVEFTSGEEALEYLTVSSADLIFCDLNMPEMDGYELMERLYKDKGGAYMSRAVMVTGEEDRSFQEQFKALGIYQFIKKPIQPSSFLHHIRPFVERIRRTKEGA